MDGVYARIAWHREGEKIWTICGEKQEANPENKAYKLKTKIKHTVPVSTLPKCMFQIYLYTQFCFSFLHLFVCMALLLQGLHGFSAPNWVYIFMMLLIPFAPM